MILFEIDIWGHLCLKQKPISFSIPKMNAVSDKMHSRGFGKMEGSGNFVFNLVVQLSVELDYIVLSLRL
jgi:hypothetical protein